MGIENTEQTKNSLSDATEEVAGSVFPADVKRERKSFSQRMGDAGYTSGRRYDAVKNAFLSYKKDGKKQERVRCRLTRGGENFYDGRKLLGKIRLVGGYIRLFLALDPTLYSADKYHHKDYSGVARYAKAPFMIKLSSDRQVKYAVQLIGDVMSASGFVFDEDYVAKDQAHVFVKSRSKTARAADVSAAATFVDIFDSQSATDVRLPRRAAVVDRQGRRIGKVRGSVWTDVNSAEKGVFVKQDKSVVLVSENKRGGYLDKNDNVLTFNGGYVATLRRPSRYWVFAVIAILLAALTALTIFISTYVISRSGYANYAPVVFVATENGEAWSDSENLPVFMNDTFGDSKAAPGMRGSYRFVFENRNDDALVYTLNFAETNEHGITILYRLKRDGAYISGIDGFVAADSLGLTDLTVEKKSASVFELEWHWVDNDEADTLAGQNSAIYTLTLSLTAAVDART